MTIARALICVVLASLAGCKDKGKDQPAGASTTTATATPTAPPTPTPTPTPAPATAPTIALQAGESLEPPGDIVEAAGTNPFAWQDSVVAGFVYLPSKDGDPTGTDKVKLVVESSGARTEVASVDFNPTHSVSYGLVREPDGKLIAVFQTSGGSGDPGFTAAWRLGWDAAAKKAMVAEKGDWSGEDFDKIPAWAKLPPSK